MKKGKGLFLLSSLLFLSTAVGCSSVAGGLKSYSYEYDYEDVEGGLKITGIQYNKKNKKLDITIPDSILGKKVVAIAEGAFKNNNVIYNVFLGKNVKTIEAEAFMGCSKLNNIVYPTDVLIHIGDRAYANTAVSDLFITNKIELGNEVFKDCVSLNSVKSTANIYGSNLFTGCTNLKSLDINFIGANATDYKSLSYLFGETIPSSLTELVIGEQTSFASNTFENCSTLTNIELPGPKTVLELPRGLFANCSALESLTLPFVGKATIPLESSTVNDDYSLAYLFNKTSNAEVSDKLKSITFHPTAIVTLENNEKLTNGMVSIRKVNFSGCNHLETLEFDKGLVSIEAGAFDGCSALNSIKLPSSIESIGAKAFDQTKLYTDHASGLLIVDKWAVGYKAATNKKLSNNTINGIADELFKENNDVTEVAFRNLKTLGKNTFTGASTLTKVDFQTIETIPENTFANCLALGEVNLPRVKELGAGAFSGCTTLNKVTLSRVENISANAFKDCSSLTYLVIPSSIKTIADDAFAGCTNLVIYLDFEQTADKTMPTGAWSNGLTIYYKDAWELNDNGVPTPKTPAA